MKIDARIDVQIDERLTSDETIAIVISGTSISRQSERQSFRPIPQIDVLDCQAFCERVKRLLPEHGHLPVAKELQRMAVQSFSKRVAMWNPSNAPVTGTRFRDYLNIAQMTGRLLGGGSLASNDE